MSNLSESTNERSGRGSRLRRILVRTLLLGAGTILALLLLEGLASLILTWKAVGSNSRVVAERLHTRHDPDLGWVNVPGVRLEDMYGTGRHLTINGQGFRAERDFEPTVPPGKLRAICSGDSFTLGFGVGDGETWVEQLAVLEPRLETVNMGQGGYGIGQAFLWYERDGKLLDHDLHVFAFITADLRRMQRDRFHVYPKPVLVLEDGELEVKGTPVPQSAYRSPWLAENREALAELRSLQLLDALGFLELEDADEHVVVTDEELPGVALALFERLGEINRSKASTLVVVQLPTLGDHRALAHRDALRATLARGLAQRGIHFVDLVQPFRKLRRERVESLFIPEGALDYPGAAGHFSREGNQVFAQLILERLVLIPEIAERLAAVSAD